METKANHVLIGAFTLALIATILLFILWASKYATKDAYHEYDILFRESVTGLSVGGVVQYNGIEVGNVRDLHLSPKDPSQVIARVRLKANTPVKVDTVAKLELQGLATGISFIQLSGGTPNSPLLYTSANDDEHVPMIVASQSGFAKLLNSSEGIAKTATDVLAHINSMLSEENVKHISNTLANLDSLSTSIAGQRQDIAALIKSARTSLEKLDRTMESADKTMATVNGQFGQKLPGMMDHLDRTLAQLDSLSKNADAIVRDNRGAIDSFANQGLAQLGPTLAQLRQTLREINRLAGRMQNNPAGFLLGHEQQQEFEGK
jgi:phospholipid/cholesterol/gamma-HCH transport system substrate-binding protein